MQRYDFKYLLFGLIIAVVVFIASALLFPQWRQDGHVLLALAALALAGAFGFLANLRQAAEKKPAVPAPGGTSVQASAAGRDIIAAQHSDIQTGGTRIETVERYYEAAGPALTSLHQLPPPPADFKGRESELNELLEAVQTGGATITGVRGMGGIGKTALALVLAHGLKGDYPDAQLFIDLRGAHQQPSMSPAEALAQLIHAFHPDAKLPAAQEELCGLYYSILEGKRGLLLLDNAGDAAQVAPLVPLSGWLLLVTSRQRFSLPGLLEMNLDTLPQADAEDLARAISPRLGGMAGELARLCGCLPLALRIAASALSERPDLRVEDFLQRLESNRLERLSEVEASLRLSFDLLPNPLQERWALLSVFPLSFDQTAAAAVWEMEATEAQETLSELVRFSLLNYDPSGERYALHDLAGEFAAHNLADSLRAIGQARHAAYYLEILQTAETLYKQGGEEVLAGLALFDREWDNIRVGQGWAVRNAAGDTRAAQLCNAYAGNGNYIKDLRLHPRQRITWLEAGLAAARQIGARDGEEVALGNLGLAYADLGEPRRAIEYYEQQLEITRQIGDRRGEGNALGNLGIAYRQLGEPRRAIEYYEQQLEITRQIGDRRGEGNALGNLGNAYADLGEPRRAVEYHEQALEIDRQIGDRHGEGDALGNLGNAYFELGEPRRAIEYYEQRLVIARQIGDRRGEGAALGNLGNAYAVLGEPRRAIEYHEQALEIDRQIGDRCGEGNTLCNLGIAYADLGEPRRAIEYYEQHLVIARQIGDRHGEGNALGNLGIAYRVLGEPRRAIEYYEQALEIARQIGDRRGEAKASWNLGLAYETLGELQKAGDAMQIFVDYERELAHPDYEQDARQLEALRGKILTG